MRPRTALFALLATLLVVASSEAPSRWLEIKDPPGPVDAALVLGGDSRWQRTTLGVRLARSGQARLLILAGRDASAGGPDFADKALELGMPVSRLRVVRDASTTREALLAVAPLLRAEGVRSVALVTSRHHQRRAFLTARKALPGISIRNQPAPASPEEPVGRWWRVEHTRSIVISEYAKLAYYALRGWI